MSEIRTWVDLLCSNCYAVIEKEMSNNEYDRKIGEYDEPVWCSRCEDHVFPIVIMKREYDTDTREASLLTASQKIHRYIEHGIEILHIDGEGITRRVE